MRLDRHLYHDHLVRLQRQPGSVAACLPYADMMEVPKAFDAWAARDAQDVQPALDWVDLCPAYALALATHAAYWPQLDTPALMEVEAQWEELRGLSCLSWGDALGVMARAWLALDRIDQKFPLPLGDLHG